MVSTAGYGDQINTENRCISVGRGGGGCFDHEFIEKKRSEKTNLTSGDDRNSVPSLGPRLSSSFSSLAYEKRTASDEKLDESLGPRLAG